MNEALTGEFAILILSLSQFLCPKNTTHSEESVAGSLAAIFCDCNDARSVSPEERRWLFLTYNKRLCSQKNEMIVSFFCETVVSKST